MNEIVTQHFEAKFPDRLRLPFCFDPALLARDLGNLSADQWRRHFVRQNYHGDWSIIPLRGPADAKHPVRQMYADPLCTSFADTPFLDPCPYFRAVMATFEAPLHTVRLMRLTPGSVIKEHEDRATSFEEGMVRLHIPVVTNPEVDFRLNGTRVVLEAGSCWYLRLSDPHSVANRGTEDRVHLVVDMSANDWIGRVFEAASSTIDSNSPQAAASAMID